MKLLFDENLSPKLAPRLADLFPDSAHVHEVGLTRAADSDVWDWAKENEFAIVTKDDDFNFLSVLFGFPPKIVWLRLDNVSAVSVDERMRSVAEDILHFLQDDLAVTFVVS